MGECQDPRKSCKMGECQDPLHQKLCVIGNETLPLRLIDVPATIASAGEVSFTDLPTRDWDFHVISHTWSQSIRNLSEAVGESIRFDCPGNPQLYNDAFRGRSFIHDPGYTDFKGFLEVLMGDGVRKVWFDALCINQAENAREVEKAREIRHMGAYYKHSLGCYVVLHGFGQGFDLLGKEKGFDLLGKEMDFECLPRWFSRVWTLQDFLLPEKLTFVVNRPSTTAPYCMFCTSVKKNVASEEGKAAVGMVTIEMESVVENCMAGRSTIEIDAMKLLFRSKEAFLNMLEELAAARIQPGVEDMNAEPDHLSMVVGNVMEVMFCNNPHTTLIRKAENQNLYFVDRHAYDLMTWLQYCPSRIPITRHTGVCQKRSHSGVFHKRWQACLSELYILLGKCYICASNKVLDMIQSRSCSGEEDRVLSILSLLGVEGRMPPLRTGQTLEEQVVKLAQVLAMVNPRLLLEMCAKDVTSSPHKGLSWMPNLGAPDHMNLASRHTDQWRMRHARVQLKEVTSEGSLRLEGHVVGAHLVVGARGSMEQHFNEANCYTCLKSGKLDSRGIRLLAHQMQDCHLEVPQTLSIPLHASAFVEATIKGGKPHITQHGGCIRLDTRWMRLHHNFCPDCDEIYAGGLYLQIPCLHFMESVDLILLLWAEVEGGESIVMLCMGTTGLQLHKIGMVRIAQEVSKAIFLSNKPTSEYNLGGFERHDVEKFWREWGSIQRSIPCNCSLSIIRKAIRSRMAICATLRKLINTKLRKKICDSPPESIYLGPLEGLSIMPSMSGPPPWPSNGIVAINWLREKFLQEKIDYFMAIAKEMGPKLKEARCFCHIIESRISFLMRE